MSLIIIKQIRKPNYYHCFLDFDIEHSNQISVDLSNVATRGPFIEAGFALTLVEKYQNLNVSMLVDDG